MQVVNGSNASNAATFTVAQSVDISGSGCTTSAPQGVAIDYSSRNLAIVTDPGCNNVAIIKLGGANVGTGQTVAVGKNPQGVAVHIQSALAVVANADDIHCFDRGHQRQYGGRHRQHRSHTRRRGD